MQDPIVMKKDWTTDLKSFLKISCHTKFRFAEREAQCILGECGPLSHPSKQSKELNETTRGDRSISPSKPLSTSCMSQKALLFG